MVKQRMRTRRMRSRRGWWRDLGREWLARRRGSQSLSRGIFTATRDIIGPTGWQWSNAWNHLERDGQAYLRSFDPRLPPSLYVSQRDRTRAGRPIPLPERCIEDWYGAPPPARSSSDPDPTRKGEK